MTKKECTSFAQQLLYSYGVNRKAEVSEWVGEWVCVCMCVCLCVCLYVCAHVRAYVYVFMDALSD